MAEETKKEEESGFFPSIVEDPEKAKAAAELFNGLATVTAQSSSDEFITASGVLSGLGTGVGVAGTLGVFKASALTAGLTGGAAFLLIAGLTISQNLDKKRRLKAEYLKKWQQGLEEYKSKLKKFGKGIGQIKEKHGEAKGAIFNVCKRGQKSGS